MGSGVGFCMAVLVAIGLPDVMNSQELLDFFVWVAR